MGGPKDAFLAFLMNLETQQPNNGESLYSISCRSSAIILCTSSMFFFAYSTMKVEFPSHTHTHTRAPLLLHHTLLFLSFLLFPPPSSSSRCSRRRGERRTRTSSSRGTFARYPTSSPGGGAAGARWTIFSSVPERRKKVAHRFPLKTS